MPDEALIEILNGLKSTVAANTKSIMVQNFMLFALLKSSPKEQQQLALQMLKQVPEAGLTPEVNESLLNSIQLASSLIASRDPEALRKLFRVISGGKDKS